MSPPTDVPALQRFLGMVNYLGKFIPDLSELSAPLRELIKKDTAWAWFPQHQRAFDVLKSRLVSTPTLKFFDLQHPIVLTCDASKFGLGAACMQLHDGQQLPVSYASRTMTPAEQRYAQIEKELLAVVFACSRFKDYILGNTFTIETDHQPLVTILNKPIHAASSRLQRMMLQLQRFTFTIVYRRGNDMFIADTLSRAPLPSSARHPYESSDLMVLNVNFVPSKQMQSLVSHTAKDPTLQLLSDIIIQGWPERRSSLPASVVPYFLVRDELVLHDGVVVKGHKVVVPESLRVAYFQSAHNGHPGAEATLSSAQGQFYWPSMANDIREWVSACPSCNSLAPHQQRQPLLQQPAPDLPWTAVATDIFEWRGKHFLVLVDSYSNWFEVDQLHSLSSSAVIGRLRRHFATFGSPARLQSDNGSQFTSAEFQRFTSQWNFKHFTSSPEYPQSNGLAERAVCSAKGLLEHCRLSKSDFHLALLNLRNISHDPALGSPAQRLLSRRTRPPLPIAQQSLVPSVLPPATVQERITTKHDSQKRSHDQSCRPLPPLFPGQIVRMQTASGHYKLATVVGDAGSPRSYLVDHDGVIYCRSRQHLLLVNEPRPPPAAPFSPPLSVSAPAVPQVPRSLPSPLIKPPSPPPSPRSPSTPPAGGSSPASSPPVSPVRSPAPAPAALVPAGGGGGELRTRSGRLVKPPVRYGDFV